MKPLTERQENTAGELLFRCAEVLKEGFRIDLSASPAAWAALSRELGSKRLCAWIAKTLSDAYERTFQTAFLFSERCMTFELKYHLNAYLAVKGFRHVRHVSTLFFPKSVIERTCHSIEIDTTDAYRLSQRIAFRYFFGVRKAYRRTEADPYAKKIGNRCVRIPLYRLGGAR